MALQGLDTLIRLNLDECSEGFYEGMGQSLFGSDHLEPKRTPRGNSWSSRQRSVNLGVVLTSMRATTPGTFDIYVLLLP